MKHIVCISGSNRPGNYTSRALGVVSEALRAKGVETVLVDARDLTLAFPGQPESNDATRLRATVAGASGIVLASPEYHGSFSAMTKLIIENLGFPSVMEGKPLALLGVAAGRIGAIKTIEQLRGVCAHVGAIVIPGAVSIAGVRAVFDSDGNVVDAAAEKALHGLAASLMNFMKDFVIPRQTLEAMVRQDAAPWTAEV
jgi:chromate reductase, NAD(P)H dehydrogenase (quinone)